MILNRTIVASIVLISAMLLAATGTFAAKGGNGKPPPEPPPPCADTFPGFLYQVEATRKAPAELHIASTDGCSTQFVAALPNLRSSAFHMTADRSAGVIVWSEDIDNRYIVRRIDFTVDNSGNLVLDEPDTILPLAGEEAPPGDHLFYFSNDIWGDATHDSLYLVILRIYSINSGDDAGGGTRDALLYDLNELTGEPADPAPESRLIFHEWVSAGGVFEYGDWQDAGNPTTLPDCSSVYYPQFVPTCYRAEGLSFNPSGAGLYSQRNINLPSGERWDGVLRIDLVMDPESLAKWGVSPPKLIYTSSGDHTAGGMLAAPDADGPYEQPSPEYIAIRHTDRTGKNVIRSGDILNTDQCVDLYDDFADGMSAPGDIPWLTCLDTGLFFAAYNHGGGDVWENSEALLTSTLNNQSYDIYRRYVAGGSAGTEVLLIENARNADNGY